jgi:uncharacterized surface protein with fasciclin (FAS1) repeats
MTDRLNITETIAKQSNFSAFAKLMASSGAADVFSSAGAFTVFVPTNDAFAKVPTIIMSELLNEPNQTQLKGLLSYHVLPGKVMAGSLGAMPTRISFTGEELRFTDSNGLRINGAIILSRNIEATNGVIHAVDAVLAPSTVTTPVKASAAVASAQPVKIPAPVPSVVGSATGTAIPTSAGTVASTLPTSTKAAARRIDTKPIF